MIGATTGFLVDTIRKPTVTALHAPRSLKQLLSVGLLLVSFTPYSEAFCLYDEWQVPPRENLSSFSKHCGGHWLVVGDVNIILTNS
ncbi:hypothetical protein IEQ34_009040 [Dendrobium chrysotoxum]|uniref:Uncharacterized protein n=1 Tax=Dendrobium chrysotoxum TaxID=161865 RepID=A0AAV7H1U3_DENCH|nr:hypothetical protein IEQ34_009040 [Dendrobium chrysotoxum]